MQRVKEYVYCCGGLAKNQLLKSCERYSLELDKWTDDVPDLNEEKFSATMMVMDKSWLYSFGGLNRGHRLYMASQNQFEIERFNTDLLTGNNKD